jgi:hypothetical protein
MEIGGTLVKDEPDEQPKQKDDIIDKSDGEDSANQPGCPSASHVKCADDDGVITISD